MQLQRVEPPTPWRPASITGRRSSPIRQATQYSLNVTLTVNGGNSSGLPSAPNPRHLQRGRERRHAESDGHVEQQHGGAVTFRSRHSLPSWLTADASELRPTVGPAGPSPLRSSPIRPDWRQTPTPRPSQVTIGSQSGTVTVNLVVGGGGGRRRHHGGRAYLAHVYLPVRHQRGDPRPAKTRHHRTGRRTGRPLSLTRRRRQLAETHSGQRQLPCPTRRSPGDTPIVSVDPTN